MAQFGTARRDDLPQLVALLGILFSQEAELSPDPQKQHRGLECLFDDESAGTVFVAREGERIVAMASLLYTISTAEGGRAALFEDLIVHPDCRGQGIATALVKHILADARRRGILRLTLLTDLQNSRAQALYRKLGFVDSSMKPMRLRL
jgi:GNAT superfamily N-acetyltransferase